MSVSGLNQQYLPNTLDGLNIVEADQVYINGQLVNLDDLVTYENATRTLNMGIQNIQTSHNATTGNDVVNKTHLDNVVSNLSVAIAGTFLDKVTTTPQTVIGNVSYTAQLSADDLLVPATKKASLGSVLTVDANYRRSETDATVSTVQYFGSITSSMGIYQATSTQNYAILQVADLGLSGTGKRMDINWNLNINEASYNSSIQLFASDNGTNTNQYLGSSVSFTPSDSLYKLMSGTFVPQYRYICALCITAKPSGVQTVRWYGLQLDEQGVDITALTMSAQGANQIPIINDKKQLVGSGVSSSKVVFLDNVSSDIQTQLNGKLNLSGNNANQDIILGGYKVQSSATPTTGNDLTNKTYVDGAIATGTATIPRKADVRTGVAPNAQPGATMSFYFGTHTNNNIAPFSDMLLLNGWTDSTAGSVNLLSLNKGGKGIRQYQGTYGSASAFSTYYDCVMTDANSGNVTLSGTLALGANKATSSANPSTDDDLCRKGYVDTQDGLRVLKAGDTMTATLYNSGGNFHPYRGGDTNRGCILTAYDADGATYASNNGGLASWFGISFRSTYDNTTRFVFNTRDGNSSQTGTMTANGVNIDGLTASRALGLDASKNVAVSTTTLAELNLLSGITSSVQNQLNAKGNLAGGNTWSDTQTFNGLVAVSNRLLGQPDSSPNGNFWMGLRGSGTEVDRLAISINGDYTTGAVAKVIIGKALRLSHPTADRVLTVDSNGDVVSSSVTPTVLGYLDIGSSLTGLLNLKANLAGPQVFSGTHTFNSATPITLSGLTAERVITLDGSKNIATSAVTTTELGYLSGVSSGIQNQINGKVSKSGDTMTGTLGMNGATVIEFGQGVSGKDLYAGRVGYQAFTTGNLDIVGAGTANDDRKVRIFDKLGIGITARAALDVEGSIITGWADYRIGTQFNTATSGYYLGMTTNVATRVLNLVSQSADLGGSGAVAIQTGATPTERCRWTHDGIMKFPNPNQNRIIVLYEGANNDHQYYGMGINPSTFRFNLDSTGAKYSFFAATSSSASTEVFRINGVGGAETGISGVNASTTPFFKSATTADHYGGNPSEVWLFNGYNGHLGIGKNATQNANTTNLMLGVADTEESQIISLATNNLTYKPMSFASSKFVFVGGNIGIAETSPTAPLHVKASGGSNPNSNGVYIYNTSNTAGQDAIVSVRTAGSSGGNPFISFDVAAEAGWAWGLDNADNYMKLAYSWSSLQTNTRWTVKTGGEFGINCVPDYPIDVNGSGRVRGNLYVGTEGTNGATIFMGGPTGDSAYDHCQMKCRSYNGTYEGSELVLFKGNDPFAGSLYPDRIRIRANALAFDTHSGYSTDPDAESIRMVLDQNGRLGLGNLQLVPDVPDNGTLNINRSPARTGTHGTGLALYVTNGGNAIAEFRDPNGSQGIGFGYNRIYATGSNTDQNLELYARAGGELRHEARTHKWYANGSGLSPATMELLSDGMLQVSNAVSIIGNTTTTNSNEFRLRTNGPVFVAGNAWGYGTGGNGVLQVGAIQNSDFSGRAQDSISCRAWNDGNYIISFHNTSGTIRGQIAGVNSSSVSYQTSSDRRLKDNVHHIEGSLNIINRLQPVHFRWIKDDEYDFGFIAQDVYKVLPHMRPNLTNYIKECSCKREDICNGKQCEHCQTMNDEPVDEDGNPRYYSLDYGKFTPYLVGAVQEQQKQIEDLNARVKVLEARETIWVEHAKEQEAKMMKMQKDLEKMAGLLSQLISKQ